MALPDDFLQELKLRCDITDVVSSYVNLKRSGRNMVGLCRSMEKKRHRFMWFLKMGIFTALAAVQAGTLSLLL